MVLVLAADMVRGVLHASPVRGARPQWTIQVYTPPRAWPFSTWVVLAVMWHLAPEDAPTGTAEEIARDLHTWPADQDYPWRRPRGGLPVAPAAEGLSLAATLQRHPDKRARHFLQTGTVTAAPPDSEWRWDAGEAQPLPGPSVLPLWYLPMGTLAHATQAVKGAFPQPLFPGVALLRSLQAAAWVRWREGGRRSSPYFPLAQGQAPLHAEGMGTVEWKAIVPSTACRWITAAAPQPMRSPPACQRLLRMVPSLARQHAFTRDVWRAILSHTREWLTNPGARYPPGPVLEQLTAPTPGARHSLHRASALTQPRQPATTHAPTAPLTAEQLYVVAAALLADGEESFVHHHSTAQIAGSIQGSQSDAPHPWHATLCGRTRVWDAGDGTPPPGPQQGEALVLQTAGYQAILHGHAGGYRSHVLAGGRWTVWGSTARQGAIPPLPHADWQQRPTQAYYMSADPWPLAVLLHTVSAPNKRQERGWVNPPALVWSPDQEEHLRAAWQGDAIRATDVPDLHAGRITHARLAGTLAVAQRGQQNPQWVVCMFSPVDAHIVVCDPERLPRPEAVVRVADCTRIIVKALRKGEHHALLLQVRLRDNARAARPGVWPAAAHPADPELQLAVPTTVYHWLQAFHDLRWRGKPDSQIGSTHWQTWLQADAQRDVIRILGPALAT